jgi:hypothetical protein
MLRRLILTCAVLAVISACGTNPPSHPPASSSPPAVGAKTGSPRDRAASYIPATAVHAVVVTAVPGPNDRTKPPAPLTITDPAKVRSLVALVNGLPLFPPGVYSCPFDDGRGVRLTFLSKASSGKANGPVIKSAVLAVAFAKANGCGGVQVTIAGAQTGLGWGPTAAEQALSISGMRWKLSGYLPYPVIAGE